MVLNVTCYHFKNNLGSRKKVSSWKWNVFAEEILKALESEISSCPTSKFVKEFSRRFIETFDKFISWSAEGVCCQLIVSPKLLNAESTDTQILLQLQIRGPRPLSTLLTRELSVSFGVAFIPPPPPSPLTWQFYNFLDVLDQGFVSGFSQLIISEFTFLSHCVTNYFRLRYGQLLTNRTTRVGLKPPDNKLGSR